MLSRYIVGFALSVTILVYIGVSLCILKVSIFVYVYVYVYGCMYLCIMYMYLCICVHKCFEFEHTFMCTYVVKNVATISANDVEVPTSKPKIPTIINIELPTKK